MFFHHIFFFSSLALRLNTPAWFWSSSVEKIYRDSIRCVCLCLRLKLLWHLISPAARSIVSNLTQFWSARSTFSCITSFTVSTFFVTDASLSTSSRLSYFWQIFCSKLPHVLSRALSFAMVAFSPALAENWKYDVKWLRRVKGEFWLRWCIVPYRALKLLEASVRASLRIWYLANEDVDEAQIICNRKVEVLRSLSETESDSTGSKTHLNGPAIRCHASLLTVKL